MTANTDQQDYNETVEDDNDVLESAGVAFARMLIENLLKDGRLDRDKVEDPDYIRSVIKDNYKEFLDETLFMFGYQDYFLPHAKQAFDSGSPGISVILLATEIEWMLNFFYRIELSSKLPDTMITEIIRTHGISAKLGWLMVLVSGQEIPDELKKKVLRLVELRNALVHYKFRPKSLEEEGLFSSPVQKCQEFTIDDMSNIVHELDRVLEDIREKMNPEYKLSKEIAPKLKTKV